MQKNTCIHILYTSDIHGQISTYNFVNKNNNSASLSRFSTYVNQMEGHVLLLDNGDVLQGSPLMDYARNHYLKNPVSESFNLINYAFYTLGNHDFNYGKKELNAFIKNTHATCLCANILDDEQNPIFAPYAIKEIAGIKLGIIGVTTSYIPHWEKPEHIKGMHFVSAYDTVEKYTSILKSMTDAIIVLYHGGYEKDLETGQPIGRPTTENEGYHIFEIPEVDVLLCGHQHQPTVYQKGLKSTIQTANQALNFGQIDLTFDHSAKLIKNHARLIKNNFDADVYFESQFKDIIDQTDQSLDETIGEIACDMHISDQFLDRKNNHIFFQFINMIQKRLTGADISLASLPNQALGISKKVTKRELAANFIYVNAIVKMEITGKTLKQALERNAMYFDTKNDDIIINNQYMHPKLEHYNFDIYDGINYTYKISNPMGKRLIQLTYNGEPVKDDDTFTLCLNSYRANGGGDFEMFTHGKVIEVYDIEYVDLMVSYIKKHPELNMKSHDQFKVIY